MHAFGFLKSVQFNLRYINMVTSTVLIALIGTLQFNSAISAAINYEPIKITVNENFNAQPGQVSPELQEPGVLHQGANFYFKPQLNLPPSYIPSHIEALISLIQQHHHSCAKDTSNVVVEKDKLIEILRPFMNLLSDTSKETLSEIVLDKENNSEIVKPIISTEEPKPVTPELLVIPEAPILPPSSFNGGILSVVEKEVKKDESIILEEPTDVFPAIPELTVRPIMGPIINYVEPKPITSGLVVIPQAPVLPPLSTNNINVVEEEVKSVEPIVVDVEPKPAIQDLVEIPEAPVLPSFSLHEIEEISSIIEEEVRKEESIILEEPTGVFPTIPEIAVRPISEPIINYVDPKPINAEHKVIPEAPVLPSLSENSIHVSEEEFKIEEPIVIGFEPKPIIQELVSIPEAPVLPSFLLQDISSIEEELKKEESIILDKPTGVFPTIPEIAERPIEEPIINFVEPKPSTSEFVVIPEAPVLPPLTLNGFPSVVEEEMKSLEPIVVDVEPKPAIQNLVEIPEAPVLPSFSLHEIEEISSIIEEEVRKEESVILEEPTGVFPTIPEIAVRPISEPIINYVHPKPINAEHKVIPEAPVLPSLSENSIHVSEEEFKIEEPIVIGFEPKPTIQELVSIPEAPVLPSFSLQDISSIKEELKKEESIILDKPTGVFPTIPEIAEIPIEEPIINFVEPKPTIQELVSIPEAPVLPSSSLDDISSIIEEELKKEESIMFEEPTVVFPTIPEIAEKPINEPIINYVEPKPSTSEFVVIPEAPVLPPLTLNGFPSVVEEEVKSLEPIVVDVEPKPAIQNLVEIPEAPVLPSFSLHEIEEISSIIEEEVRKEESVILEEPTGVFPTIPEIAVRPISEPIINYVHPKPINAEHKVIPEAPVLPSLSENSIHVSEEEFKIEKPIVIGFEPKPTIQELVSIPEAPVLPSFSLQDISSIKEELKKEESIILDKPTGVFPTIPEIAERPIEEPIINFVEPKPTIQELVSIPEAPVLPSFSLDDISSIIEEELKKEESIILEEPTVVFPTIPEIAERPIEEPIINYVEPKPSTSELVVMPEAPVLPPLTLNGFPSVVENVKKEESIILEESTGVFPTITEIAASPITEPIINYGEPNPSTSGLVVIPEAPVLPPVSLNDIHAVVTPFPKLNLKAIKSSIWGNKKQFLYPTSYAHDVVEKRIAPNMAFKKQNAPKRVKIFIRSNVPKGPSYL